MASRSLPPLSRILRIWKSSRTLLQGLAFCVCVLILNAVIKLLKSSVVDKATLVIYAAVAVGSILTSVSPIIFVLLAGIAGVLLQNWKGGATK